MQLHSLVALCVTLFLYNFAVADNNINTLQENSAKIQSDMRENIFVMMALNRHHQSTGFYKFLKKNLERQSKQLIEAQSALTEQVTHSAFETSSIKRTGIVNPFARTILSYPPIKTRYNSYSLIASMRAFSPVLSPANGVVRFSGILPNLKTVVIIAADKQRFYILSGMEQTSMTPGAHIQQGDLVGRMGGEIDQQNIEIAHNSADTYPLYIQVYKNKKTVPPNHWHREHFQPINISKGYAVGNGN